MVVGNNHPRIKRDFLALYYLCVESEETNSHIVYSYIKSLDDPAEESQHLFEIPCPDRTRRVEDEHHVRLRIFTIYKRKIQQIYFAHYLCVILRLEKYSFPHIIYITASLYVWKRITQKLFLENYHFKIFKFKNLNPHVIYIHTHCCTSSYYIDLVYFP